MAKNSPNGPKSCAGLGNIDSSDRLFSSRRPNPSSVGRRTCPVIPGVVRHTDPRLPEREQPPSLFGCLQTWFALPTMSISTSSFGVWLFAAPVPVPVPPRVAIRTRPRGCTIICLLAVYANEPSEALPIPDAQLTKQQQKQRKAQQKRTSS